MSRFRTVSLGAFLRRLRRNRRGTAVVEFALAAPVLVFLAMGGTEFALYLLLLQKCQNAAFNVADLAARDKTLSAAQLDSIFKSVDHLVKPFDFEASGRAIVSGIGAPSDNQPEVYWQRRSTDGYAATSRVGAVGGTATLPPDLEILAGQTVIASEVFYQFEPLFGFVLDSRTIHKTAYFKPRLGTLHSLE